HQVGIFAGRIRLSSGDITKEVLVVVNVVDENSLFDASIQLVKGISTVSRGKILSTSIDLIDVTGGEGDVTVNYIIKDYDGNIVYVESETFYVSSGKNYDKKFSTEKFAPGEYIVGIEVIYAGGIATSSQQFTISESKQIDFEDYKILFFVLIAAFISIVVVII